MTRLSFAFATVFVAAACSREPKAPSFAVRSAGVTSQLVVGSWLDTKEVAVITLPKLGEATVEPLSRVRLVEASEHTLRFQLEKGAWVASVAAAPPRLLVVETPAVKAVELTGCEYRLSIEPSGAARLEVLQGTVSLEGHGASARVLRDAICVTHKGQPPGIPRAKSATRAFIQALDEWETQSGLLEPVLSAAQRVDAVSLWNLLARVKESERGAVVARLQAVVEKPSKDSTDAEALWQSLQ